MPVDNSVAESQWQRFQYMRDNGHLTFLQKADKCDKFFAGEQWLASDLERLRLQRRPAITINKIISTVSTILGEQIYNRSEALFRPASGANPQTADALTKVWTQVSQENQLQWTRSDMFCDGIIRSRGFYDMRLDFTESMQGKIKIALLNGKNVLIDPDAEEYDPDFWADVMTTKWMSPQDIATLYNKDDAELLRQKTLSAFPYGYDSMERVRDRFGGSALSTSPVTPDKEGVGRSIRVLERQFRELSEQLHFVDLATGDMRAVPAGWDRNRISLLLEKAKGAVGTHKKLIKRVKWRVTADNVVLHDDWSPYSHFTVIPYFPNFRHGNTVGVVENLLGPQEVLNKVTSQELHVVNTTANSGWKVEENSLTNMTVHELENAGSQTGLVLEFKKGSLPPEKISPNQTPTGLDRLSYKAEEAIKSISNVSDSMQGFDRADVAAKAISYKREQGSVNLVKVMDNLARTDWILARNALDLIQGYYTEERIIHVTHSDPLRDPEVITVNAVDPATQAITNDLTIGDYDIIISSSDARANLEDSQFEQARGLKEIGVNVPDSVLILNSRLQNRAEILKQMEGDEETNALAARAKEAEVAAAEADVVNKQADTTLKQAKAVGETTAGDGADPQAEFDLKRYEMEQKHALEKEKMEREFDLKNRQMEQDLDLKREQMALDHQRQQAADQAKRADQLRQQAAQPTTTEDRN